MIKKIIVRQVRGAYLVYIDGEPHTLTRLSEKCNVTLMYLRESITRPDIHHKIKGWIVKAELGIPPSVRTFFNKDGCPMFGHLVKELSGCKDNAAGKRIRQWVVDGDYDKLFRPVLPGRGPKFGTTYKPRKPRKVPDTIMAPRKEVKHIKPAGWWERENL